MVTKQLRLLVPVQKAQGTRRITYGVVLGTDTVDLQGDLMMAEGIELWADTWMEESQAGGAIPPHTRGRPAEKTSAPEG